jgi:hypothetical protein
MASYVIVTLDTTSPATPTITLDGGATYATDSLVDCQIGTTDGTTTGYSMKLWGDVDTTHQASVQATEGASSWITFENTKQIRLSAGEGQKTVYLKLRDDVYNESSIVQDSITFDASRPIVTVTSPDVSKISKVEGRNIVNFSFTVDSPFEEYMVKVVNSTGASQDLGTVIETTNGSVNTSGTGTFDTTTTPITVSLTGTDIENASGGDGLKTIKVFVRDSAGLWSA